MWDGLDDDIRNIALTKLEVVQEILTGYRDGHPAFARDDEPRPPSGLGLESPNPSDAPRWPNN